MLFDLGIKLPYGAYFYFSKALTTGILNSVDGFLRTGNSLNIIKFAIVTFNCFGC